MEQAGIWLRVSSTGQDEESQRPDVMAWCDSHGYEVAAEYVIHGHSAFKGSVKFDQTWAEVIDAMRKGIISVLVVWKLDRIDRKLNAYPMLGDVVEAGGRVEFVTQPHLNDLTTMAGRLSLHLTAEIAYAESADKRDRMAIKHAALRNAGSLVGSIPYGFTVVKQDGIKTLVPDPAVRPFLVEAIDKYLAGASLLAICRFLDAAGITTSRGKAWTPMGISRVFKSEALIGRRVQKNTVMHFEGIISREKFSQLQAMLDDKANRKGIAPSNTAMLTSVAICYKCGGPMYRKSSGSENNGGIFHYYRCHGTEASPSKCRHSVSLAELEAHVNMLFTDGEYGNRPEVETTIIPGEGYLEEIAELEDQIRNLDLDSDDYDSKLAELRSQRQALKALPSKPARTVEQPTGRTVGEAWSVMTEAEKRSWLLARGIKVRVTKPVAASTILLWP